MTINNGAPEDPMRDSGDVTEKDSTEPFVIAHEAASASEALVIRGLLESAGIHSPDFDSADPFPMNEPPEGAHGTEVWVRESQVADARRIISESARNAASSGE